MTSELQTNLPRTYELLQAGIRHRWHPGAQICIWHEGQVLANGAVGNAAEGIPMRPDSVNLWLSAGKPIGAVAMGILKDRGRVDFDAPVADYWPEFAQNGKEAVTLRHLLTHTGGIRTAEGADRLATHEEVLAAIAAAPLEVDWVPGEKAAYHATSGWHVLGEVVRRVSGLPYDEFTRQEIFAPLGMSSSMFTFTPQAAASLGDRAAVMHVVKGGKLEPHQKFTPKNHGAFVRPGSGFRSTAVDMVQFYRMLLGMGWLEDGQLGDGVRVLEAATAREITSPQRVGMKDHTFGQIMDWGLGVMFDNKAHSRAAPYGYGPHASPRTFGHGGRESSTAFADPEHQLVMAVVFNGMPGEPTHDRRLRMVTAAVYEDLRLA